MSLQKKCFTASAIFHGLLLVLVFVGSAFIPPQPTPSSLQFEIVAVPDALLEEPNVISGNPSAGSPEPVTQVQAPPVVQTPPPQPAVQQTPPPQPEPEAVREQPMTREPESKPDNTEENPFDLTKAKAIKNTPRQEKPNNNDARFDSTKAKVMKIETSPKATTDNNSRSSERANAAAAAQVAQVLQGARQAVQGTGSRVGISYSDIIGPGGRAAMSYDMALAKFYEAEFKKRSIPTRGNEPAVEVEVTVRRDGTVIGDRITKRSGRAQFDRAVQDVLNTVKKNKVIPFPADFKSETRTIKINFNLEDSLNNG